MAKVQKIIETFKQRFNTQPVVVKSPGRINVIGEHLDYNLGTVLPAAIDKHIYLAIGTRNDNEVKIYSFDFHDEFSGSLDSLKPAWKLWPNYILGVVDEFIKDGKSIGGINIVVGGDIPLAAGMSSSAALSCAAAYAIDQLYQWNLPRLDLARIAQKAENNFVGVQCGLMDQFASFFGQDKKLIKLDCASFQYEYVPFGSEKYHFLLFDSGVKHHLISSEYNKRRQECQQGLELVKSRLPHINTFADIRETDLEQFKQQLPENVFKRCLYVVQELKRVEDACKALNQGNYNELGQLMYLTHGGLKDLYEVSCPECDFLVDYARSSGQILGARMMGAGFGGCTINLIENSALEQIITEAKRQYTNAFGKDLKTYHANIGDGSSVVETGDVAVLR